MTPARILTSGRKYRKSVNNAIFICNESLFVVSAAATSAFQLIKAHAAVAMQHMPCGLSNTDPWIWENISHVALRGNTIGAYMRYIIKCNTCLRSYPTAALYMYIAVVHNSSTD